MRLLHTSDWHLGRTFHGADLLADQATVLRRIAELVAAESVDVVLVAGDIFDRAVPSAEAVRVATTALTQLRRAGAQLVITPGNHDSAARLGVFGEFAAAGGLHLRTDIGTLAEPTVLTDGYGPVACYGIPYLEPETARHGLGVPQARGHHGVLAEAMRRIRADLAERPAGTRSVVLAHAFVTGATPSDSERSIAVGGVEQVAGSVFDGIDYVALGHLHGPQRLAEHLRYSGSPLAYSFSEARQRKSVWLVDLDETGLRAVRRHELPVPRRLATLRGELATLLTDPAHAALVDCYLSVTLTDPVRPVDGMRRLRERFPYAMHLEWENDSASGVGPRYPRVGSERSDVDTVASFLADCRGRAPDSGEIGLIDAALAAAAAAER